MNLLLLNIKELIQVRDEAPELLSGNEMKILPTLKNAWLHIDKGVIQDYGTMDKLPELSGFKPLIVPTGWCCQPGVTVTRIVYAGNREQNS